MEYPDYVQNQYDRVLSAGLPGMIADANPRFITSFIAAEEIEFGRVVSRTGNTQTPMAKLGQPTIAATAGKLIGSPVVETSIDAWKAITDGAFKLTVDGTVKTYTAIDFSTATDLTSIATLIGAKITADATIAYDATVGNFTFTSKMTGASSSVKDFADNATGTSIKEKLGFGGTPVPVVGTDSVTSALLGVVVRTAAYEAKSLVQSNITTIKEGELGAVLSDGAIRVQTTEACTYGSQVYFSADGKIHSTSSGNTALGTAKFRQNGEAGEVVVIDVVGVR